MPTIRQGTAIPKTFRHPILLTHLTYALDRDRNRVVIDVIDFGSDQGDHGPQRGSSLVNWRRATIQITASDPVCGITE